MKICEKFYVDICFDFLEQISSYRMAGFYDIYLYIYDTYIYIFKKKLSSCFLRWWYQFVFSTAVKQSSNFSKFSPTLGKFLKKISSLISGFATYFIMVLIWIACGILQDQGLNPCLPHWQLDFLPLQKVLKSDSLNLSILFFNFSSFGCFRSSAILFPHKYYNQLLFISTKEACSHFD